MPKRRRLRVIQSPLLARVSGAMDLRNEAPSDNVVDLRSCWSCWLGLHAAAAHDPYIPPPPPR